MTTTVKTIEQLVTIVKPFVSKSQTRPVLTAANITPEYILATDSHRAIRIKHNQVIEEPYLHTYKGDPVDGNYPNMDRLFPDTLRDAQITAQINVKQWLLAHQAGLTASKEHDNNNIELKDNHFYVKPVTQKAVKGKKDDYSSLRGNGYKTVSVPEFEQISYTHSLAFSTGIDVTYNCKFMIDALKAMKAMKQTEATLYFYGKLRPMLFVAGDVELLILPVRVY